MLGQGSQDGEDGQQGVGVPNMQDQSWGAGNQGHVHRVMNEYPGGEMTKQQFIETCEADDTRDIAESLFKVFDKDKSGTMDFW